MTDDENNEHADDHAVGAQVQVKSIDLTADQPSKPVVLLYAYATGQNLIRLERPPPKPQKAYIRFKRLILYA